MYGNLANIYSSSKGEMLFLHLATPFDGISVILTGERRMVQIPMYFSRRVLQEVEHNYTDMEKLILALVHATERL